MGQARRTTKLLLDLSKRDKGGANTSKRAFLDRTAQVLNDGRTFYIDFFLAHAEKFQETVLFYSQKHLEMRERPISSHELLTWAEAATCTTAEHPHPWEGWNFSQQFPQMPFVYRRSVIKDAIGKVRSYLSNCKNWEKTGKKQGRPGLPGAANHPTLYQGTLTLDLATPGASSHFIQLKVYTGERWEWHNYPVQASRYLRQRLEDREWDQESPKLVLRQRSAELHFPQTKPISKKQYLSGKPVKGEHSNQQLWTHVRRMNRRQANQLRGKINQYAQDNNYAQGLVTVEVNPHGTSQYCSKCGARGERFSSRKGVWV